MLLVKDPVPVPSLVWLPVITGEVAMLQQTPLAVTVAPPSDVTLPPLVAAVEVIFVTAAVVTVGGFPADGVVKDNSFPYEVPSQLVAKALTK